MSTRTPRSPNYAPAQHLAEMEWISFALSCKSAGNGVAGRPRIGRFNAGSRILRGIPVELLAMITTSKRTVALQIPIAV